MFITFLLLLFSYVSLHGMDKQSDKQDTRLDCKQALQLLTKFNISYVQLQTEYNQNTELLAACSFKAESTQYEQEEKILTEKLDALKTDLTKQCKLPFIPGSEPRECIKQILSWFNQLCLAKKRSHEQYRQCSPYSESIPEFTDLISIKVSCEKKYNLNLADFTIGSDPDEYLDSLDISN